MPVADSPDAPSGGKKGRGGRKNQPLLVLPPATTPSTSSSGSRGVSTAGSSTSAGSRTTGAGGKGSGASAASSSSSSSYDYAEAQRQRDRITRNRYVGDAEQMTGQIRALRAALGPKGEFKDALKKRLDNIETVLGEQMADLDKAEAARSGSLDADQLNNEMAVSDSSLLNDSNRARERTMALSEAAMQGAGESDTLKTQMMSLRSGAANQLEINRAFHDGQRSINNSRIDLALDTHNARVNMVTEANADREQLWTTFYNQSSETQTQLGNALGQQAEYYGLAREAGANSRIDAGNVQTGSSSSSSSTKGGKGGKSGGKRDSGSLLGEWSSAHADGGRRGSMGGPLGRTVAPSGGSGAATGGGRGGIKLGGPAGSFETNQPGGKKKGRKYGPGLKGDEARASDQSDRAFMAAAQSQGRAWDNPGLSKELQDWEAPVPEVKQLANSSLSNARTTIKQKRPEGATLRSW